MRKLTDYTPTKFMAKDSRYDADAADYAVGFIECLCHTKGTCESSGSFLPQSYEPHRVKFPCH
ncbi:MAG: hypothetical protein E7200_09875 [Selenomonas ruminantium]|nr:hypothetical protein [Selenomonas ruminantium]